jgi:predicted ATP-dependent endonuclease of OLD family
MDLLDPNRNTYTIRLKKDGNIFLLNQASSGEVELINFILGMITLGLKGGIIIVDEPELHLHPKWIAFLRGFFMQYAFTEKNQLMVVTHSSTFINSSTYPYISRVYKNERGSSSVHQVVDVNNEETKERLHFINATNNEKVFFSDFVVMVEGDTDEIVFKQILEVIKKESGFKSNVEVMQVKGKTNYEKFNQFLKTLQIESCFIGDLDNVAQMATGNEKIKHMLMTNEKRVERLVIKNPGAKDNVQLTQLLEESIKTGDLEALKGFYDYMISFRQKLRLDLSSEERQVLDAFIISLYDQNIFLLKRGEIEAYFPNGYKGKDLDKVLALTQGADFEQWKKEDGYNALKSLLIDILHRNRIV